MDETLYYYVENGERKGPLEASQLASVITPDTQVWTPGMTEWMEAKNVEELNQIFNSETTAIPTPPSMPAQPQVPPFSPTPATPATPATPNFGAPVAPYTTAPAPQKKNNNVLIGALVAVAVVALAAIGYIIYSNYTTKVATTTYGTTATDNTLVDDPAAEGMNSDQYPYEFLLERSVTYDDIAGKSSAELRIMRNYIFARHSYIFKSADLREYFSQFSWYTPKYVDVTRDLSKMEQNNVQYIKKHE
ncbi:MAG: YARHG domain-containing protein [Bacteroidales bacterium]|nr:YARHG domain-containing protein [Bacteroidales bacterium]